MLDTNIFNHVLDGTISISQLKAVKGQFYVTHIQLDEITATTDAKRRSALLKVFSDTLTSSIPTESSVWGVSRWGQAKWTTKDSIYATIVRKLQVGQKRWNTRKHESNMRDALIAETSIRNGFTLISNDKKLCKVVEELGGKVKSLPI